MSTILYFSVNMGCYVYINEEKKWKSEKFKGVWILSVPTVSVEHVNTTTNQILVENGRF